MELNSTLAASAICDSFIASPLTLICVLNMHSPNKTWLYPYPFPQLLVSVTANQSTGNKGIVEKVFE